MDARENQYRRQYYVEGTAARQLQVVPDYEREQEQRRSPKTEQRPVRAPKVSHGIDLISMILLIGAMAITLFLCYNYLQVQGNIVQLEREVKLLNEEAGTLLAENAALEDSLNAEVDWENLYMTAVGELGMVYPNNNEVVTYRSSDYGYVIQYKDIPE